MELKTYQREVLNDLEKYLAALAETGGLRAAWEKYWDGFDISVGLGGAPPYNNIIDGVPHVCLKVPTGGGKTFLAVASIKPILERVAPNRRSPLVVWLVPSEAIYGQTLRALSDSRHPYRQRLDCDFGGQVAALSKEELLGGQDFSPDAVSGRLTVAVFIYNSLRVNSRKKEDRKVFQENGSLATFARWLGGEAADDTALINILRQLNPVVIVDESHNTTSDLSVEMVKNLNPSFVLELTATPRDNSNIVSFADARALKKENMVKLPVVVYNRPDVQTVMGEAIKLRVNLEKIAKEASKEGAPYIRPIVLFQAQPKTDNDSESFDKIKEKLIKANIPEAQIAIKTANKDELKGVDLLSRKCPIRYVITVNALKEGWDCPFAYILASLANRTSVVDVEQIVGRILRQPNAMRCDNQLLNLSYVLTCSEDFHATLGKVVEGLNRAGFSNRDYRVAAPPEAAEAAYEPAGEQLVLGGETDDVVIAAGGGSTAPVPAENAVDDIDKVDADALRSEIEESEDNENGGTLAAVMNDAVRQGNEYDALISQDESDEPQGGKAEMQHRIFLKDEFKDEAAALTVPQFFLDNAVYGQSLGLFEDEVLLEKEDLSEGFSLLGLSTKIDFAQAQSQMYTVDIAESGDAVPQFIKTGKLEREFVKKQIDSLPSESKKKRIATEIYQIINQKNRYLAAEIKKYVSRIVEDMSSDSLAAASGAIPLYAERILDFIRVEETKFRRANFDKWRVTGRIITKQSYSLPKFITHRDVSAAVPKSVYAADGAKMNGWEKRALDEIVALPNIKWWHRIVENHPDEFCINGFINHYPDFLVMTQSGKLVLVETKGDHLDNEDSRAKIELGAAWQSEAGKKFRYFMVFENKEVSGAYTLEKFLPILGDL